MNRGRERARARTGVGVRVKGEVKERIGNARTAATTCSGNISHANYVG